MKLVFLSDCFLKIFQFTLLVKKANLVPSVITNNMGTNQKTLSYVILFFYQLQQKIRNATRAFKFYEQLIRDHGFKGKTIISYLPGLSSPSISTFFLSFLSLILQAVSLYMVGKMTVSSHSQFNNVSRKDTIPFPKFYDSLGL